MLRDSDNPEKSWEDLEAELAENPEQVSVRRYVGRPSSSQHCGIEIKGE